jgi:hypothetical protein
MTKKLILVTAVFFALISVETTAIAGVRAGSTCTKAGTTSTLAGKKFTCIKFGGKLIWNKGVVVSTPKASSPSPTSSPKSTAASQSPKPTLSPTPTQSAESADFFISDLVPSVGRGIAPAGAQGNGPWATGIRLASSPDGITFTPTGEILSDQAGVPNLVVGTDKRLRCYYVNFQGNQIVAAIQMAPNKWIYKKVRVENLAGDNFPPNLPVDPAVVVLPDGKYRLYYMQPTRQNSSGPDTSIFSAISSDGINFKREAGARLAGVGPDKNVYDPTVLITPTKTYLWSGPDGAHFASSDDGLLFKDEGQFKVGDKLFMTWSAAVVPGGGYRIYGNTVGPGGANASAFSSDGKNWTLEINNSLKGDIGVAAVDATHWVMAYLVILP